MEAKQRKVYLGDAVYASHDGYHVILTTEDGLCETNRIYLPPEVVEAFNKYHGNLMIELAEERKKTKQNGKS